MKKDDYLTGEVLEFVEWISNHLDRDEFSHAYRNRRSGERWECRSIFDAYTNYKWSHPEIERLGVESGNSFASNAKALEALRKDLTKALDTINDRDACQAAIDIVTWGGVRGGNVNWLLKNEANLAKLLNETRKAFDKGDLADTKLFSKKLRFNAGMTKVYSLICENFVIYDSRVAAALGWAVVKFCRGRGIEVPTALRFPWAPAKEAANAPDPKCRKPGENFPKLKSGAHHAEWNLRANWILSKILEQDGAKQSEFSKITDFGTRLRALESALFMIGYDLPGGPAISDADLTDTNRPSDLPPSPTGIDASGESDGDWVSCETLRGNNPFRYKIDASGIVTKAQDKGEKEIKFEIDVINRTLSLLANANKQYQYGGQPFGLYNSATKKNDPDYPWGLGKAYLKASKRNPPDTSRLAAVLEDVGILVRSQANGNTLAWKLSGEVDLNEGAVSIGSMLEQHLARESEP